MKQFIYMDNDIVTSIIAQEEKGIITQQTQEKESGSGKSGEKDFSLSANAKGGAKLFKFIQGEAGLGVKGDFKHISSNNQSSKDVIEKILHDAAFDIAYNYISPRCVVNGEMTEVEGAYLEIKRTFDYVDFAYLEQLFEKGGIIEFIKKNEMEKAAKTTSELTSAMNREQKRKLESGMNEQIKRQTLQENKKISDVQQTIKAIRQLVPYDRILVSHDGFLIPLDDQYFRINPKNLGFKYGGEITCVGMVTNIIRFEQNTNEEISIFAKLHRSVNAALKFILPQKTDKLWIIHPIAIYYTNMN